MVCLYSRARWVLPAALLLALTGAARAQAPVITSVIPMANARAVARNAPLTVTFSQPLPVAAAGALKVFSSQRGGLRARGTTPAVVSGNTLSFAPTAYPYLPGETVQYTVVPTTAPGGGTPGRVGQFTTAVGGTGGGNFQPGTDIVVGNNPVGITSGDIDGDGDVDLLVANSGSSAVSVLLNDGRGQFASAPDVSIPNVANVALADVDSDGDLDLLAPYNSNGSAMVSVQLNTGGGNFSLGQTVGVGSSAASIVVADVNGDGDLDLLTTSSLNPGGVSVRLNGGSGLFSGTQNVSVGIGPYALTVGDIDADGDLDLVTVSGIGNVASVRLNDGNGVFSGTQSIGAGSYQRGVALGDVDGDGDLDLLTSNQTDPGTVTVRLNDGSGLFTTSQTVNVGSYAGSVILADVDADSDLDLLATNGVSFGVPTGSVSIRLNNGNGSFSGTQSVVAGNGNAPYTIARDLDGDGDLDLAIASNTTNGVVKLYLNGGTGPLATTAGHTTGPALALFPNPAASAATLSGATPGAPISVLDALGRVLLTATADATGAARLVLPAGLPAGVYLMRCGGQVRRLAVE
ncbi:FG-GAP repeat domain-containing protein [Hymenobacter convexus]|uniref:FG-GAP repeat domain-containing protein n=1 Tax=Hymenobacter sp. CA1UV-4 TaxID=3063782 RepID=UPI002712C6DF|nr:VCBS repeat-containing protein [Hymenobacter sp. CA1UV-4]MDO7850141.1 VCBS repeat-containing protein [Hymenobacter sp. CA1UV-4]